MSELFLDRRKTPLPKNKCKLKVLVNDADGLHCHMCEWNPHDPTIYFSRESLPATGFLGSAKVMDGKFKGIGFNVWAQNDYEFIWYLIID